MTNIKNPLFIAFTMICFINQSVFAATTGSSMSSNMSTNSSAADVRSFNGLEIESTSFWDFLNPKKALSKQSNDYYLSDPNNRIHEQFRVPEELKSRVSFWFDIYTKYDSGVEVIHHSTYPWIVFAVVDNNDVLSDQTVNKFTRVHRAERNIKIQRQKIKETLLALSKKKNLNKLSDDQKLFVDLLRDIPGKNRQGVFAEAAHELRSQKGQKDFFQQGLISSAEYIPKMEEIFAQYDLPVEVTRLPLVESSFNTKAVSKVGASGIWQFMPAVGKQYMKVNDSIDERNSPIKATQAAARMMLSNYRSLQSWPLVLTSYNHGIGGIKKAVAKTKSNDLAVIINKYHARSFGFASSNFYSSFLAAVHAERYQEEIFGNLAKPAPLKHEDLKLRRAMKILKIAEIAGITKEEVRLYNPDIKQSSIKKNFLVPKGYVIHLPEGRLARLEMHFLELEAKKETKKPSRKST